MLTTLPQKAEPAHTALILVDVLNAFCAEGGAMHREGRDLSLVKPMMPRLHKLIQAARVAKVKVVWIQCAYNTGPNHYLSEVWLEQAKHRYGAFENTDLDLVLRSNRIKSVIITGVATNVCCETTARQAFMKDYYVLFTSDCCATYSQAQHDATLFNIDQFFGQVVTSDEIMACWPAAETKLRAVSRGTTNSVTLSPCGRTWCERNERAG